MLIIKEINISSGEAIYKENDYDDLALYLVAKGEVQIFYERYKLFYIIIGRIKVNNLFLKYSQFKIIFFSFKILY